MAVTYTWGTWEESWQRGRFSCVFIESYPDPDGMIRTSRDFIGPSMAIR